MSFFTNLRADRLVTEIRSSNDPASPATKKAVERLIEVGPGAIEAVFAALPDADRGATVAFGEVLAALVSPKTFPEYVRGLVEGSPRVVTGVTRALTASRNYPQHLLLDALATAGVSKPALLEVIAAHKARFGVRELLNAAYAPYQGKRTGETKHVFCGRDLKPVRLPEKYRVNFGISAAVPRPR